MEKVLLFIFLLSLGFLIITLTDKNRNSFLERKVAIAKRFEKSLHKVSREEKRLYSKIWNKILFSDPECWDITSVNGEMFSIKISNIDINMMKTGKKYEATTITIDGDGKSITLNPPLSDRLNIFDMFIEIIQLELEKYFEEKRENEKKQASDEYEQTVRTANKYVKDI